MEKFKDLETFQNPCKEDEIDLYELILVLKKRWKLTLLPVVLFLVISVIYLLFTTPKYKSTGYLKTQKFSFSDDKESFALSGIPPQAVVNLINYIGELLNSPEKKELNNILGANLINEIDSIRARTDRRNPDLIIVDISAKKPDDIGKIFIKVYGFVKKHFQQDLIKLKNDLNNYLKVIQAQIEELKKLRKKLVQEKRYDIVLQISEELNLISEKYYIYKSILDNYEGLKIIMKPPKPIEPYSPKPLVVLAISTIGGLFTGIFLVFVVEWWEENRRKYKNKK